MNNPLKKMLIILVSASLFVGLSTNVRPSSSTPFGQRFIFSLPLTHNKATLKAWLQKTKPAGVMLEAWHMRNRLTIKQTVDFIQSVAHETGIPPLFVALDWEGGIVSRANEAGGFVSVPAPYNLAKGGRSACFLAGKLIGRQAQSIGVNVIFAPSLDLFDKKNCVLATRCFSSDPAKVFEFGFAFAQGILSEGVMPVIKHFPGLGRGLGDTHLVDVKIDFNSKDFQRHTSPFMKALDEDLPAVMVSHAEYSNFDNKPASQSESVVNHLRQHNVNVLLITDDIAMMAFNSKQKKLQELVAGGSLRVDESFLDSVMASLTAGFHLLIYSQLPEKQCALLDALEDLRAERQLTNHTMLVEKTNALKKQFVEVPAKKTGDFNEEKLAYELACSCNDQHIWVDNFSLKSVLLISGDVSKIRPSEDWFITQKNSYVGMLLKNKARKFVEVICDPKASESVDIVGKLVERGKDYDLVIVQTLFQGQGDWNKNQERWLKKLMPLRDKLVVFSLGHPYEQTLLGNGARVVNLGSFHKPELTVACERLLRVPMMTGSDRLMKNPDKFLKNKRIGLLCHNCSYLNRQGSACFLPDALKKWVDQQEGTAKLTALFSPEHGLQGTTEAAASVATEQSSKWGCPVYSLHGNVRAPTDSMLEGLDVLLIDLQEVGVRCYTYLSTMALTLETVAKRGIEVIILERPNPLKALGASGPMLESSCTSFLGKIATPFMHGASMGSLAKQLNEKYQAKLTVLECIGDENDYFFTRFRRPSPNLMSREALFVYPMSVVTEAINYAEGRGTLMPFQQIGAPWVDGKLLANTLNEKQMPGVYFEPTEFIPESIKGIAEHPKYEGQLCKGVFIHVLDHDVLQPTLVAHSLLDVLWSRYPQQSQLLRWGDRYALDLLIGTSSWHEELMAKQAAKS